MKETPIEATWIDPDRTVNGAGVVKLLMLADLRVRTRLGPGAVEASRKMIDALSLSELLVAPLTEMLEAGGLSAGVTLLAKSLGDSFALRGVISAAQSMLSLSPPSRAS